MRLSSAGIAFLVILFCVSGAPSALRLQFAPASLQFDADASGKEGLLTLHQADRRAHFHRDVDFMVAGLAPEFTMARDGKIRHMTRDDVRKQFAEYFNGIEFSAWDDLEPPIIQVSPDGKMGWMMVRARIAYTKTDAKGAISKEDTVMSWMSAYEQRNGKWLLVANASTSQP